MGTHVMMRSLITHHKAHIEYETQGVCWSEVMTASKSNEAKCDNSLI